jgi:hypothetical protein
MVNSEQYISEILWPFFFFVVLRKKKRHTVISWARCCYSTHSAKYSIDKVSRFIFLLFLSVGKLKNKAYSDNLHALHELKHSTCETITSVKVMNWKLVSHNLFMRLRSLFKGRLETFWESVVIIFWTLRNAVFWCTMLQAGRSWVQSLKRSLDFSVDLTLPSALWPWGQFSL